MEGILIAIISGLFSLAGIWLKHYLDQSKASQQVDTRAMRGTGARVPARSEVKEERKPQEPVTAGGRSSCSSRPARGGL